MTPKSIRSRNIPATEPQSGIGEQCRPVSVGARSQIRSLSSFGLWSLLLCWLRGRFRADFVGLAPRILVDLVGWLFGLVKRVARRNGVRPSLDFHFLIVHNPRPGKCGADRSAPVELEPLIMPKMKTNRAAAKRFKLTGSGRVRRSKCGGQHGLIGKNRKRRRRLRDNDMVDSAMDKRVKLLLPYG